MRTPPISVIRRFHRCGFNRFLALGLVVGWTTTLAGCDPTSPTDSRGPTAPAPDLTLGEPRVSQCPPAWQDLGIYNCRPLTSPEKNAIQIQFSGPGNNFRWADANCAEIASLLSHMIDRQMYSAHWTETGGYAYHSPDYGIVLPSHLFTELTGYDPYAAARFSTVTHELAHRISSVRL